MCPAWGQRFELVWLSDAEAAHSRQPRATHRRGCRLRLAADLGEPDRGVQLFGAATEARGGAAGEAAALDAARFPAVAEADLAYRTYRFRPRRLKLFDERALGAGAFVTARVARDASLAWERTDVYRSGERS